MIVVSLLLILVAVTLLALGLVGGSSALLISSIVASLLAAVALVVGARQAATRRRGPRDPASVGAPTPGPAPARRGARRRDTASDSAAFSDFDPAGAPAGRGDARSDFSGSDPILADDRRVPAAEAESPEERRSPAAGPGLADDRRFADVESGSAGGHRAPDPEVDLAGGHRSPAAGSGSVAGSGSAAGPGSATGSGPAADSDAAAGDLRDPQYTSGAAAADSLGANRRAADDASSFDGRLADEDVAQRAAEDVAQPTSEADAYAAGQRDTEAELTDDRSAERVRSAGDAEEVGRHPRRQVSDLDGDATVIGAVTSAEGDRARHRDPDVESSSAGPLAGASAVGEATPGDRAGESSAMSGVEFGDPDEDEPADEPPPQSVRPSDAVSVARMDAEVLVVDGRPRYHLADCPHLVGRHAEPLPANEAVELGFSPCSRCRPVDRLVAQAARR